VIEAVEAFTVWLRDLPPLGIYAVLFLIAWGENVVPPLPGDVAVVVAGSFVSLGIVGLVPVFAVATVGSVLGFLTVYAVGRRLGAAVHDPTRLRWIPREPVRAAEAWLARWGLGVVAANRFLSGGRAVIALLVGASDLKRVPVALWATVSAVAWNVVLVGGGYALGAEWERVVALLRVYGRGVTVALGVVAVVLVARWWRRRATRPETGGTE
jgi:membrane protein DedA with SNARE-associated domain